MICNRCDRTLRGNEYQDHWKDCTKRKIVVSNARTIPLGLLSKEKKRVRRIKKKLHWKKSEGKTNTTIDTHWVYTDPRFKIMRYPVLKKHDFKCLACKTTNTELHIDHIKPVSKRPELAFDINNLQVLCRDCNLSKSNKFDDDLRDLK